MSDAIKIPENYQAVMPYLVMNTAARFLDFAKEVFGAKEMYLEHSEDKTIRHAEIAIHRSVIMFADSTPQNNTQNSGLFVYVENADETYKKAIENGATAISELSDQSYGRTCGVKDPFGNTWWITSAT